MKAATMILNVPNVIARERSDEAIQTRAGPDIVRIAARIFANSCAAAIVLAALLAPTCCLDGAHAHGGGHDGLEAICFSRPILHDEVDRMPAVRDLVD